MAVAFFKKICVAKSFDSENEFYFHVLRLSVLFTYSKTLTFLAHGKLKNQTDEIFKVVRDFQLRLKLGAKFSIVIP